MAQESIRGTLTGAGSVVALVLLEWTVGWVAGAAWTQSWKTVKRGHFRITAWSTLILGVLAVFAFRASAPEGSGTQWILLTVTMVAVLLYLVAQYLESDLPAIVTGGAAALFGSAALASIGSLLGGWQGAVAGAALVVGAFFLGAVTNGMMLGHWYLNQPGLKPWALARLTQAALIAVGLSALIGLLAAGKLAGAETEGAVLGLPGFGDSFGVAFYGVWVALLVATGLVVVGARRCIKIRSIQSATGLYYVAILTAGVAEFLVRYLMVNAT